MRITLTSETSLHATGSDAFQFESGDEAVQLSAFHLLAAGLAYCTYSVLYTWAQAASLDVDGLALDVSWSFAEEPARIEAVEVRIVWPSLPPARRSAAIRAAGACAVHATLVHGTEVEVTLPGA